MDRYLLNDILEYRNYMVWKDYLVWRDKINGVNKDYHDKVYFDDVYECLRCQRTDILLWNWEHKWEYYYKTNIYHFSFENDGYECTCLDVKLPENC